MSGEMTGKTNDDGAAAPRVGGGAGASWKEDSTSASLERCRPSHRGIARVKCGAKPSGKEQGGCFVCIELTINHLFDLTRDVGRSRIETPRGVSHSTHQSKLSQGFQGLLQIVSSAKTTVRMK